MSNLLLLTKINIKSLIKNYSSNKKKSSLGVLLIIGVLIYLEYSIYITADLMMEGYKLLNIPYMLIAQFMLITSLFVLFTNMYKSSGTLFKFKDYDLLMSLPIKKSTIITSKIIILYILSLFYTLFFMIPIFITYAINVNVTFIFCLLFFLTIFIIPMVPLIISTIIGVLISSISSRFKHKNIVNYIIMIAILLGVMYYTMNINNMSSIDMANIGKSMVNTFNKIYPLTGLYVNIISNSNILSLLLYMLIPITIFYIFIKIIIKYYSKINDRLSSYTKSNKYKMSKTNRHSSIIALYKKELKRYTSSAIYVMNTSVGVILLTIFVIGFVIFGSDKINELMGIPELSSILLTTGPLLIGAFFLLSCTTSASISLEGKNLWIIKSIPIKVKEIFFSKIMVNLTILIPAIIINSTILCIYLKTDLLDTIFMFITPIIYSLFISILGIVINLLFPNFTWKNEIKVIKQSMSAFLTIMIAMVIAIVPLSISYDINSNIYILIITSIVLVITYVLYLYINSYGIKVFNRLN
ncbi:MAG TPA: hypothetical protein PLC53_00860 [Bacilli bacterium]|mgnify:CR=1 FL=1|nr:hypothetical protein [Bacilli bacterium]